MIAKKGPTIQTICPDGRLFLSYSLVVIHIRQSYDPLSVILNQKCIFVNKESTGFFGKAIKGEHCSMGLDREWNHLEFTRHEIPAAHRPLEEELSFYNAERGEPCLCGGKLHPPSIPSVRRDGTFIG